MELSNLFESLYSHFLLRDIAAKVLPGLISLGVLLGILNPESFEAIRDISAESVLVAIVILYGLGFGFGMLIQSLGAWSGVIWIHAWQDSHGNPDQKLSLKRAEDFTVAAKDHASLLRKRERLVILKEMAGNYAIAILFIVFYVVVQAALNVNAAEGQYFGTLVVLFILFAALLWQNRHQAREQREFEEITIANLAPEKLIDRGQIQRLARTDGLTGLLNRHHTDLALEKAIEEAEFQPFILSVSMIDIDGLKTINDASGHIVGDVVLREVARILVFAYGDKCTVGRFGGDEFLVVSKGIDRAQIRDRANTARRLAGKRIPEDVIESSEISISLTVGVSLYPKDGRTREELLRAADKAMYTGKSLGGDRVEFA